jgi:hypothetical protein
VVEGTTHVQVSVCPTYPRAALCTSQEIWDFANAPEALRENFLKHNHIRRIPDGLASPVRQEGSHVQGQYDPGALFQTLAQSLVCARRLYGLPGYSGNLTIQTALQNVRNEVMFLIPSITSNPNDHRCITGAVHSVQLSSAEEIKNGLADVLCRSVIEIGWSFWQSYEDFPVALLERSFRAAAQRFG